MNISFEKWIASFFIFISGYAPLALIYTLQTVFDGKFPEFWIPILIMWVVVILSVIFGIRLVSNLSDGTGTESRVIKCSNKSGNLLIYTLPYILALLQLCSNEISLGVWIAYAGFMLLLFYLMVKTNNIFINPFLIVLNYNLYDVEYKCKDKVLSGLFLAKRGTINPDTLIQKKKIQENVYIVINTNKSNDDSITDC